MNSIRNRHRLDRVAKGTAGLAAILLLVFPLTGCIIVGGASRGGFFLWPGGGLGLLLLIIFIVFMLRRR